MNPFRLSRTFELLQPPRCDFHSVRWPYRYIFPLLQILQDRPYGPCSFPVKADLERIPRGWAMLLEMSQDLMLKVATMLSPLMDGNKINSLLGHGGLPSMLINAQIPGFYYE